MLWVASLVDCVNEMLDDRDVTIGPSYFMRKDLDEDCVRLIWSTQFFRTSLSSCIGSPTDHAFDTTLARLQSLRASS